MSSIWWAASKKSIYFSLFHPLACIFAPSIEFYNQNTFFIISTFAVVWKTIGYNRVARATITIQKSLTNQLVCIAVLEVVYVYSSSYSMCVKY